MTDGKAEFGFDVKALARQGQALYDRELRANLEAKHFGRFVAVEPESGKFWLGDTVEEVCHQARTAVPGKLFHLIRIGSPTAHIARCLPS